MLSKNTSKNGKSNLCLKLLRFLSPLVSLTVAFALFAVVPNKVLAAKEVTLKIQTAWAPTVPILGDTLAVLAETVDAISGGQLKLKIYEPKKLAPSF